MRQQACVLISLLLLTAAAACGKKTVVCPPNYHPVDLFCFPDEAPQDDAGNRQTDVGGKNDAGNDTKPAEDLTVTDTPPAGEVVNSSDVAPDAAKPDVAYDGFKLDIKQSGKGNVGAACSDDLDCLAGMTCFNWPKGYCTLASCDSVGTTCPGSSQCWGEEKLKQICSAACEDNPDCRVADGYACKRLSQDFGNTDAKLCLPGGKSPIGLGCSKPLECAGSAICLTDMPGGYCARLGCGAADPCDAGSSCVLRNGKPMCLKTCAADSECQIASKQPRKCVAKTDLTKKPVSVCLDSTKSAPVGSACVADLDCDSKLCTLFAKGTCKIGAAACLSDEQCGASAPCVLDPAAEKGTCSAPCATDKACPTGGVCIPGTSSSGTCEPSCKGPKDDASCGGVPGLECVWGKPLPSPNGLQPSTYACAARPPGSTGSNCSIGKDCKSLQCFTNAAQTAGFCLAKCGTAGFCPFGTICVDNGVTLCQRLCYLDEDCPPQMACKNNSQAGAKVCDLP